MNQMQVAFDPTGGERPIAVSDTNPMSVKDLAIAPGQDSAAGTGRTWGGPKADSKVALTANGVIKAAAGYYYGYIVTTATSAVAVQVFDNASTNSGTVVDTIPASQPVGHYELKVAVPVTNGMFAQFGAATGTILFLYI